MQTVNVPVVAVKLNTSHADFLRLVFEVKYRELRRERFYGVLLVGCSALLYTYCGLLTVLFHVGVVCSATHIDGVASLHKVNSLL